MNPPIPPPSDPDFPPRPPEAGHTPLVYPANGQSAEPPSRTLAPRRLGPSARSLGGAPKPNAPVWRYALVGVLLALTFFLGVFMDRAGWLARGADREPANVTKTFGPFWEVWNLVHANYVDQKSVDDVKMTREAIAGMLDALGDEGHTIYLSPEDAKKEQEALKGKMEGIGAVITMRDHIPTIVMTMPESPARKAGLKPNDILLKVDDKVLGQTPLGKIVEQVRGPAGTNVALTVQRDGQTDPIQLTITRAEVVVPDVTWHMLPGEPYMHVALRSFGEHADEQLRKALAEAKKKGAKGVILDLRGNPGGYKDQAVDVTSEFLKSGDVFIEENVRGDKSPVPVKAGGTSTDAPLVVLIDGGSASAAEITAGALQDHKRAELVGEKSFGTGTVLQPFELSDGSELHLATLKWLTPDGHEIWHHGIEPDVKVELKDASSMLEPDQEDDLTPETFKKTSDVQLLKALDVLRDEAAGKDKAPGK